MSPVSLPSPSSTLLLSMMTLTLCVLCHVTMAQQQQQQQQLPCPNITKSPVLDDKVARSEVLVQGQVRRKVTEGGLGHADVQLECVFKGGRVPSQITVSWKHWSDERCEGLGDGAMERNSYLFYLNRPGAQRSDHYSLTFKPDPAQNRYLEELKYACGLAVQLPQGVTESEVCKPDEFELDYPQEHCKAANGSPGSEGPASLPTAALCLAAWLFVRLTL